MTLTPQQEQDLAPVVYEWNMLVAAAERVRSAIDSGDQLLTNLVLEAFVVHFRQLGNFFFTSPDKGDLHVGQFVGGQSWKAVTGRKNRWDDLLVRASKQVAHLTAERHFKPHDKEKQQWPVSRLVAEVAEELQVFCDRTGFAGFPGIVPSTGVLVVDIGSAGSMSAEHFTTTATKCADRVQLCRGQPNRQRELIAVREPANDTGRALEAPDSSRCTSICTAT